jgi:hypothetical protein
VPCYVFGSDLVLGRGSVLVGEKEPRIQKSLCGSDWPNNTDGSGVVIPLLGGVTAAGGWGGFAGSIQPTPALATVIAYASPPEEGIFKGGAKKLKH